MKKLVRKTFHKLGLDIVKHNPQYLPEHSIVQLLNYFNISTFLDVGANTGQTGYSLLENNYRGRIISFEPITKAYKILLKNSEPFKKWEVAEQCALGNKNSSIEINVSKNLQSSSILPMYKKHIKADPTSKFESKETVKIYKADTIFPKYLKQKERFFLKIDAQGYEKYILAGAKRTLAITIGLQVELSLVPLYKGEETFDNISDKLKRQGFHIYQIYPGFTDRETGQLLQADFVFFRKKTKAR